MPDLKRRRTILLDAAQVAMMLIKVLFFDAVVSSTPSSSMQLWGERFCGICGPGDLVAARSMWFGNGVER